METLPSVMILAVSAMVLLGMRMLWDPQHSGSGGLFAGVEHKFDVIFNGGEDVAGNPGNGSGGVGSSGGNGSDGDGSGGDGSGGDGSGGDGSGGNGSGGNGSGGNGSGGDGSDGDGSDGDGSDGDGSGDDGSGDDEKPPIDPGLDPLGDAFTTTLAKAVAERSKENHLAGVAAAIETATQKLNSTEQANCLARQLYEAGMKDPNLTILDRAALQGRLSASNIALMNARVAAEEAVEHLKFVKEQTTRFSRAVGVMGAVDGLVKADRKRQELIAAGKYEEAWRESVGGATRYVASVATTFTDKLPGATGSLVSEVIASGAEVAGRQLADNSFPSMVDLSHWLYEKPWWPRDRPPRFPKGYDPRRK